MLRKLFNIGVDRSVSQDIVWRVRITNGITLFLIFFALVFVVPSLLSGADVSQTFLSLGIYAIILLLNKFKFYRASRFALSILPALVVTLIHLSLLPAGALPSPSLYFLQVSMSFIPWLVFSFREKGLIFFLSALNFLLLISYKWNIGWGKSEMMAQDFENQTMGYMVVSGAYLIMAALFYAINLLNNKQAGENDELIQKMQLNQQQMEDKTKELNDYIEKVKLAKKEDEQRQWFSDGIAQINRLIQNRSDDYERLKDELLETLVKYLKANQAAIFEVDENNDQEVCLEMTACYAYNRKKYLNKKIKAGEGLTGQCYLEQDVIYLTDVPGDYINITSGLGKALPRAVIMVPMIANNKVEGVIEMAFFEELPEYKIKFLKVAGQSIASYLVSEKTAKKTYQLLQESQGNSEQLRAQEEEMRQNMEEMTVTQEQLERQKEELSAVMKAINTSNCVAEFSAEGVILSLNESFCNLFGIKEEQMAGQNHKDFDVRAKEDPEAYQALWEQLHDGHPVKLDTYIKLPQKSIWMKESYTPIMDNGGNLKKVILISADITDLKLATN